MTIHISGIDETGRGSVVGPLIIVGLSIEKQQSIILKDMGVKDSKLFSGLTGRKKRSKLAEKIQQIAQEVIVVEVPSSEIDIVLGNRPKDNLNLLELRNFSKLLLELNAEEIFIDTISSPQYSLTQIKTIIHSNDSRYHFKRIDSDKDKIESVLRRGKSSKRIIIEKKADSKHMVVAAASCVAKHLRDERLRDIEKVWGLPDLILGQGYPNIKDHNLIRFLQEYKTEIRKKTFPFIRYQWDWECLQQILKQPRKKLDRFL